MGKEREKESKYDGGKGGIYTFGGMLPGPDVVSRELATWHCSDLAATLWRTYSD
jgi:hypothetical protein